jgi:hypothetical protein
MRVLSIAAQPFEYRFALPHAALLVIDMQPTSSSPAASAKRWATT